MTSTRRSLLAAGAVLPFLRMSARAATTPGKLVFGLSSYPPTMAPWANAGTAAATAKLMFHRGLLGYDADGTLRGELAEKWEHADDGAWVLHLRDAVFQNGAPVTSADVAWTIEQVAGEKSTAYLRAEMQRITKSRHARCQDRPPGHQGADRHAALPAGKLLPADPRQGIRPRTIRSGVGAGPFLLTNEERGVALEFKAFDKFYRPGLPKLKSLRMVAYADENLRVAALQAGDVDLIEYVPWQSMPSIEADAKLALQTTPGPFMYLTFNAKAKPFDDPRVRQRDRARDPARGDHQGGILRPRRADRGPAADRRHRSSTTRSWRMAGRMIPAKAKALLAAAGVGSGFTCKLLSTAQYGMHKDTAAVVQQHLAAVGIQAELVLPDWATRVTLGNRGQYELAVMGSASEYNDPDGLAPFLAGNLAPSYVRSYRARRSEDRRTARGRPRASSTMPSGTQSTPSCNRCSWSKRRWSACASVPRVTR